MTFKSNILQPLCYHTSLVTIKFSVFNNVNVDHAMDTCRGKYFGLKGTQHKFVNTEALRYGHHLNDTSFQLTVSIGSTLFETFDQKREDDILSETLFNL